MINHVSSTDKNIRPHAHARICRFATLLLIKHYLTWQFNQTRFAQESAGQSRCSKYYAQVVLAPEMKQKQSFDQSQDRCTLTGSDIKQFLTH
ncbi:hypothetical protein [Bacteroides xylanisolvens]|uniref:hypothetical protein n=1 Tax=Bacteroides xylanisolvens TaxID=371601 RepID=UPI001CE41D2F|nr:hypothetical protein [Bacteroides xylanisolvens]